MWKLELLCTLKIHSIQGFPSTVHRLPTFNEPSTPLPSLFSPPSPPLIKRNLRPMAFRFGLISHDSKFTLISPRLGILAYWVRTLGGIKIRACARLFSKSRARGYQRANNNQLIFSSFCPKFKTCNERDIDIYAK